MTEKTTIMLKSQLLNKYLFTDCNLQMNHRLTPTH